MAEMYGTPLTYQLSDIRKAEASGDLERMKAVARDTEEWLKSPLSQSWRSDNLLAALEALKLEIAKLENQQSQE